MEKQRKLVLREDVDALIDELAGVVLTHLGGMAARCGSRDMQVRRNIDAVVMQVRREIAEACLVMLFSTASDGMFLVSMMVVAWVIRCAVNPCQIPPFPFLNSIAGARLASDAGGLGRSTTAASSGRLAAQIKKALTASAAPTRSTFHVLMF